MKRFAYACIGVLALALAFHLGARVASSSSVDCLEVAHFQEAVQGRITVVTSGLVQFWMDNGNLAYEFPLPRDGAVADAYLSLYSSQEVIFVVYRDGEIWFRPLAGSWQLMMNVACQPIAVEPSTWGQIKAQSRAR